MRRRRNGTTQGLVKMTCFPVKDVGNKSGAPNLRKCLDPRTQPRANQVQAPRHQWHGPKHGLAPSTKHNCPKLRFLLEKKQVTIQRFAPMFVMRLPSCNAMPLPLNRSIAVEPRPILHQLVLPTWESVMTCVRVRVSLVLFTHRNIVAFREQHCAG